MRLTSLLILCLTPLTAAPRPVPLADGGFEDGLGDWTRISPTDFAPGTLSLVDQAHGGRQAARIVNPTTDQPALNGLLSPFIPLPDDARTFELRLWMKADVAPKMVEVRIAATDATGQALGPWKEKGWRFFRPPIEPMTAGWSEFVAPFGAQDDWGGIAVTVWVHGSAADVLIDEIELTVYDPRDRAIDRVGAPLPASGATLWWEGPLRRVYPDEAPTEGATQPIELAACGDEHEVVQLCFRPDQPIDGATFEFTEFAGPATLPATIARANWVGLIEVTKALGGHSILGPTPDPLLPEPSHDLPAGQTTTLWVTVHVPRGTPAGDYTGAVRLQGEGLAAEVPLRLHVYGFDLPKVPTIRTISRIWKSHPDAKALFMKDIQEHRAGGTSRPAQFSVKREGDALVFDAAGFAKEVRDSLETFDSQVYNVPGVFLGDVSGLYNDDGLWQGFPVFTPEFDAAFSDYCRRLGDALREEGVLDYGLWQIWDEPKAGEMTDWCRHLGSLIKAVVPEAKIYLTTDIRDELIDLVGIWNLPWPRHYDPAKVAAARDHGAEIWAYQNSLYSLDVADSSLAMRGYLWRLRRYGVQGVEWWAISDWQSDPWTIPNQYSPQNGGGFFLYPTPDRTGPPIDSVRWEMYREGVEDYDILTLFAEREGDAAMAKLVSQVALSAADVSQDPRVYERVKREICARLEATR